MYGMNMFGIAGGAGCAKDGWNETSGSSSRSELVLSSGLLGTSVSSGDQLFFPGAEFFDDLGTLGLNIQDTSN